MKEAVPEPNINAAVSIDETNATAPLNRSDAVATVSGKNAEQPRPASPNPKIAAVGVIIVGMNRNAQRMTSGRTDHGASGDTRNSTPETRSRPATSAAQNADNALVATMGESPRDSRT